MGHLIYVAFDHLNRHRGALKEADPATDVVVMVESQRMLTNRPWHPLRLFYLVASARHFVEELRSEIGRAHV
mgnify:FL=1